MILCSKTLFNEASEDNPVNDQAIGSCSKMSLKIPLGILLALLAPNAGSVIFLP